MSYFDKIFALVKQIPSGKVTTYSAIAQTLGAKDARKIGWALHGNKDFQLPCHRVVKKDGSLAAGFLFKDQSGSHFQQAKLAKEGIKFVDDKVDLEKYFWQPVLPKR